jgi:hypothetical protein
MHFRIIDPYVAFQPVIDDVFSVRMHHDFPLAKSRQEKCWQAHVNLFPTHSVLPRDVPPLNAWDDDYEIIERFQTDMDEDCVLVCNT